jgi:hypothetical protein
MRVLLEKSLFFLDIMDERFIYRATAMELMMHNVQYSGSPRSATNETIRKALLRTELDAEPVFLGNQDLPCEILKVDRCYQRPLVKSRVERYAKDWSDVAAHVITVSQREDGHYVIDGNHRVNGKKKREPQSTIPCRVYRFGSLMDEARTFVKLNSNRKPVSSASNVRALYTAGDDDAKFVYDLVYSAGWEPAEKCSSPDKVACIGTMYKWATLNPDVLERVWELYLPICAGRIVHGDALQGFCYLENAATAAGQSICDGHVAARWAKLGYDALIGEICGTRARMGKGGERVFALGLQNAYNRNMRSHRKIELVSEFSS